MQDTPTTSAVWNEVQYRKVPPQYDEVQHQVTLTGPHPNAELVSLTPGICSIEGMTVRSVALGRCNFEIRADNGVKLHSANCAMGANYSYTEEFAGFVPGSLAHAWWETMHNATFGKAPGATTQNQWLSATYSTTPGQCAAVQNPDMIFKDVDFSAISFCRGANGYIYPVTLITPRHVLFAQHTGAGGPVVFRNSSGGFQSRTILSTFSIEDLAIGLLSSPVTDIEPMRVLPLDIGDFITRIRGLVVPEDGLDYPPPAGYFGVSSPLIRGWFRTNGQAVQPPGTGLGWPVLTRRANTGLAGGDTNSIAIAGAVPKMRINMLKVIDPSTDPDKRFRMTPPVNNEFASWGSYAYGGDSGSVSMLMTPIGGQVVPVLLGATWTSGESGTTYIGNHEATVAAMRSLAAAVGDSTQYDFRYADLSEYPKSNVASNPY